MARKNAPFYSCKAGKPESIKAHRLRSAALNSAGEHGQIYETQTGRQRQVHMSAADTWMTVSPEQGWSFDLKGALLQQCLVTADAG